MLTPEFSRSPSSVLLLAPSRESVLTAIEQKQASCHDIHEKPKQIELKTRIVDKESLAAHHYYELMRWEGESEIEFIQPAMTQLLGRLGMSVKQYNRSPDWLKAHNFNYFNRQYDRELKFRMRDKNTCRAVLSTTYGIIDDVVAMPAIFEGLKNRDDVGIRVFEYNDYITRLSLQFSNAKVTHQGIEYTAGLLVTNSETGHSSIWIEPVVYTGNWVWAHRRSVRKQGVDCRIIHRGKIDPDRVRDMVEQNSKIAQVGIVQLVEAWNEPVSIKQVAKYIKDTPELPNRWEVLIAEHLSEEDTLPRAAAAREILRLAESLPLFQRALAEQAAGAFIGLFDHFEERMFAILGDLA